MPTTKFNDRCGCKEATESGPNAPSRGRVDWGTRVLGKIPLINLGSVYVTAGVSE